MALTKARKAKKLLNRYAPKGEKLAYINDKEAKLLKKIGGSGKMTTAGIRSYTEDEEDTGDVASSRSSSSSSSSDNGGGYDYEGAAYGTTPAASYSEPDTSGDDQEDDVAQMMADMGLTPDNAPTDFTLSDAEDDGDTGESLYVSPTQEMKEKEFAFKPAPFQGPYVDARDDPFTTAKNTNTGILQTIGSGLKTAGKFALPFVAAPIAGLVGGKTAYEMATLGMRGKRVYDFAKRVAPDTTKGITTAFTKDFRQGTGGEPPAATGFDDNDRGSNIIPKNVIASNVQKYSPEYKNRAIDLRDRLQPVQDRLTAKGQMTLASLNKLIEQFQV